MFVMQTYNMSNIKYFKSSGATLLIGDVEVITPPRNGILIKSSVSNKSNIIVNRTQFRLLRDSLTKVPVTNNPIYLYDQLGNLITRMESGRKTNNGGTLEINTEPQTLLSHMVIPNIKDENATNYLILQEYSPLNIVYSEEKQSELLKDDIAKLNENTQNMKNVVLVIGEKLHETFKKLYPTYTEFFNVIPVKDENIINYVAEHLCGKLIAGTKPIFQGFLNFGSGTNVLSFSSDNQYLTYTIRSNGRVQINTEKESTTCKFIAIIENSKLTLPFTFNEEITGASFKVNPDMSIKSDTYNEIKLEYIISMMEIYKFSSNLDLQNILDEVNYSNVIKYLFTKPIEIDKEYSKLWDNESQLIVQTYEDGFSMVKTNLIRKIQGRYVEDYNNPRNGRYVEDLNTPRPRRNLEDYAARAFTSAVN